MTTITATTKTATTETATTKTATSTRTRYLVRSATVAGAALSSTVVFGVGRALGADFTITDPGQGKVPHTFVAPEIAIVTVIIGLLGWAVLAGLERWTRRPQLIWSVLAAAVVLLSLVPIGIEVATTQTRIMLGVVHVVVGVTLLPLLRQSGRR